MCLVYLSPRNRMVVQSWWLSKGTHVSLVEMELKDFLHRVGYTILELGTGLCVTFNDRELHEYKYSLSRYRGSGCYALEWYDTGRLVSRNYYADFEEVFDLVYALNLRPRAVFQRG